MYNKIFTKILDSSVWLESTPTRIVWITLLAAMDEVGFCPFAAVGNVASRARVTDEEARDAIATLESPDTAAPHQEHEGRRIERVPGGWIVINAKKYRDIVTRAQAQETTRQRVSRFREKKRLAGNGGVTQGNAVTTVTVEKPSCNAVGNAPVTPSEAEAVAEAETEGERPPSPQPNPASDPDDFNQDPEANIPEGMAILQYAGFVLQQASIPAGYALKVKTGDTIEMLAKDEGCTFAVATKRLLDRMRNAGPQKWNFWLQDGGWKQDAGMDATERAFLYGVPDD
jgi:hypothetical protein